jgi:hypothetical protein
MQLHSAGLHERAEIILRQRDISREPNGVMHHKKTANQTGQIQFAV